MLWALAWGLYFRDKPADHPGITPEELALLPTPAAKAKVQVPWAPLIRRIIPVTIVYFCYGWILWLFLSWIPSFFKGQYKLDLKSSALFASGVFFSGVVGDTVGGIISDKLFERTHNTRLARCNMVAVMMLLCGVSLAPILYTRNINVIAIALRAVANGTARLVARRFEGLWLILRGTEAPAAATILFAMRPVDARPRSSSWS